MGVCTCAAFHLDLFFTHLNVCQFFVVEGSLLQLCVLCYMVTIVTISDYGFACGISICLKLRGSFRMRLDQWLDVQV
jgi:hypothetical protein